MKLVGFKCCKLSGYRIKLPNDSVPYTFEKESLCGGGRKVTIVNSYTWRNSSISFVNTKSSHFLTHTTGSSDPAGRRATPLLRSSAHRIQWYIQSWTLLNPPFAAQTRPKSSTSSIAYTSMESTLCSSEINSRFFRSPIPDARNCALGPKNPKRDSDLALNSTAQHILTTRQLTGEEEQIGVATLK